ncbi:DHA2 family efflux MFS transporter permease subunit [Azospirillum sp. SYSU D00513]|uniref:DHA2 family efflux MFS transporter permease subunit n=1 Tax=Azospirillum sp. SYSU D00513 TaxID=2812561 RepID=UPI001A9672A8|nr:DHA2 family efflux MFS transporter permease subunit [Azospirillum sp. SYSU D00513]
MAAPPERLPPERLAQDRSSRTIPLIVAVALFMEALDSTVIATVLPQIAQSMGEDPLRLSMAMTSYLLALAVFLPASGWVADRFGARTVFASAIVVFLAGSVLCGLSQSLLQLVGARIVQGIGGAMMVPVGRLILLRSVPRDQLVAAISRMAVPALIGPAVGPVVGGFIATYASWRWIFYINVPIGLIGLVLVLRLIPNVRVEERTPFDGRGFLLAALALAATLFGVENLGHGVLPGWAVAAVLATALLAALLYVRHARRHPRPLLDLSLLRFQTYRASVTSGTLFRIGIGASSLLVPLLLQLGFGFTAFEAGSLTFAGAAGAILMKVAAGPVLRRFGFRRVLIVNGLLSGLVLMGHALLRPDTPHLLIIGVLLLAGFLRSLQFTGINTLAYAEVPQPRMSGANALASVMQQLSLSLGVAAGAVMLHLTHVWSGRAAIGSAQLSAADFVPAFLILGVLSWLSVLFYRGLPPGAGDEVSGHRSRRKRQTAVPPPEMMDAAD